MKSLLVELKNETIVPERSMAVMALMEMDSVRCSPVSATITGTTLNRRDLSGQINSRLPILQGKSGHPRPPLPPPHSGSHPLQPMLTLGHSRPLRAGA